jgi:hypothetical protein
MAFQRESTEEALARWADLEALQEHYTDFADFLYDVQQEVFGWETTEVQYDIGDFLQYGGNNIMLQAQRGQAKTTLAAIFCIFSYIHNPKTRVVIISAGSGKASQISKGIVNIINGMPMLACLRPDKSAGDRTSVEQFDIHYTLRGEDMNPSLACLGVTATSQGYRADILLADDVESSKNSMTQAMRELLLEKTKDFISICTDGRIIYLGTPQSVDSIYNALPSRGYIVRVWPGRFPTPAEAKEYGDTLAPWIIKKIAEDPSLQTGGGLLGDIGKAIDTRIHEEILQKKELDQGPAYFKLQHMLCTKLSDTERFPLKLRNLVFMSMNPTEAPGKITWLPRPDLLIPQVPGSNVRDEMYRPCTLAPEMFPYSGRMMYVDTAGGGQNGDETVAVVTYFLHGYVFVAEVLGLPGGMRSDVYDALSALAFQHKVNCIEVEKNFGHGAFAQSWRPVLASYYETASGGAITQGPIIEDIWESGQKEKRIVQCLEPIMARHHLIFNEEIIKRDHETTQKYPIERRSTYSLLHQMSKITLDRHSLIHDDRLDALAGAVRHWVDRIAQDADKVIQMQRVDELNTFMADPFGHNRRAGFNVFDKINADNRRRR